MHKNPKKKNEGRGCYGGLGGDLANSMREALNQTVPTQGDKR